MSTPPIQLKDFSYAYEVAFQSYQDLYYSKTSGVGQNVNGRYFIHDTGEYVTVKGGVILKVEKPNTEPLFFSRYSNVKFIKEKETDEFRFESLRNGYCRETKKIVAPQIPSIDSNEFDCLCLPDEEELSDPNFDGYDVAFSYYFDLVKEQVRVHVVDGKLNKVESLTYPNKFVFFNTIEKFLTKERLKEALKSLNFKGLPVYSDYLRLYNNFTSGGGSSYCGEFFIESTGEIVKIENGRIISISSTDGGPNYSFFPDDNVRYVAENATDPNINNLRNYYNYFNRETDSVSGRVYQSLETFLAQKLAERFIDPVIFTLEQEQIQVVVDGNGKFKQFFDLKSGKSFSYEGKNVIATKTSLGIEVQDILSKRNQLANIKEVESWNRLYGSCTSGTGSNFTGTYLVKDVNELVTVEDGCVVKLVELNKNNTEWIWNKDQNIRYVCKTKEEVNELRSRSKNGYYAVSTFFNIYVKDEFKCPILKFSNFEEALKANGDDLHYLMKNGSILPRVSFSFELAKERIVLDIVNGKLASYLDNVTNEDICIPENEQVFATKENVQKFLDVLEEKRDRMENDKKLKPSDIPNEDGHIVVDSYSIPTKYINKNFEGSLVLLRDRNCLVYLKNRDYHREDGPAYSYLDESKKGYGEWFRNGIRHNIYGPAITWKDGCKSEPSYYIDGKHYETKEAWHEARIKWFVEQSSGDSHVKVGHWADKLGKKEFTGSVIDEDGVICYYKEGKYHREGGLPAWINPVSKVAEWLENGEAHNLNGVSSTNSNNYRVEGNWYSTEEEWRKAVKAYRAKHSVKQENLQNHESCGTNNDVRDGDLMVESPAIKDIAAETTTLAKGNKKNMSSMNLKDEAIEAAYRVAVTQIRKMIQGFLADQMAKGARGKKAQENARSAAMAFFSSELGAAILCGVIGSLLPMISDKLPEKYTVHLDRLAKEFRVDAMTTAGNELIELLKGSAGSLMDGVSATLDTLDKQTSKMEIEEATNESEKEMVTETVSASATSHKG